MGNVSLESALAEVASFEIAPLPRVAHQLTALAEDEDASLARFVELLKTDPATASAVLRAASSPVFAAKAPIASLAQAVSRLGLQNVAQIALAVALRARFVEVPGYERELETDYRTSVAVALFAQRIARSRKLNAEEAFLAGLLCDVGRPAILSMLARHHPAAMAADRDDVRQLVEAEHAAVGRRVLAQWKLSDTLGEAAATHHDHEPRTPLGAIVQLANALARGALAEPAGDEDPSRLAGSPAAAMLNLYDDEIVALAAYAGEVRTLVEVL